MRTAIYIDGFNFYYGAVKNTAHKWVDLKQLCKSILQPHHQVVFLKYFTAKVNPKTTDPDIRIREATYFKALETYIPELSITYGHFLETKLLCRPVDPRHGKLVEVHRTEEKGSDVNLAVHLVSDAHIGAFDCAVVISNDSDLAEAMRIAKDTCGKRVGLFIPGGRRGSKQLMAHSDFTRTIRRSALANFQLPNPIPGTSLYKPQTW